MNMKNPYTKTLRNTILTIAFILFIGGILFIRHTYFPIPPNFKVLVCEKGAPCKEVHPWMLE